MSLFSMKETIVRCDFFVSTINEGFMKIIRLAREKLVEKDIEWEETRTIDW